MPRIPIESVKTRFASMRSMWTPCLDSWFHPHGAAITHLSRVDLNEAIMDRDPEIQIRLEGERDIWRDERPDKGQKYRAFHGICMNNLA